MYFHVKTKTERNVLALSKVTPYKCILGCIVGLSLSFKSYVN